MYNSGIVGCGLATLRGAGRPAACRGAPPLQREGQEVESGRRRAALGLPLLLRLKLLAEYRRYLALHERPRNCRVCQWALFSTWTVYLRSLLSLDGVPGAGEAELVVRLAGALHEVSVLKALLAERALEQRGRRGSRRVRALARLRRRHRRRRGHVPRARRPPPAV